MTPQIRTFLLPKAGHGMVEYEDAWAVSSSPLRAAVADGATESAFARAWAEQLVRGAVAHGVSRAGALAAVLPTWQAAWARAVADRLPALPWYAAAKAEQGAFAALLSLAVAPDGTWQALAVGDCCLLHVRDAALVMAWPLDDPAAFSHRPALLASRETGPAAPVETTEGTWHPGDVFLLATDALAAWLLRTDPAAPLGWTDADFRRHVDAARADGTLRNDDVTLVRLCLPPARVPRAR
ncbi:MAG: hypothetical protein D6685_17680 [Bacteroidetes bacterium]|nr:MAG: hypothetical protein D6685_17680 [Bacteroidota bacterium]